MTSDEVGSLNIAYGHDVSRGRAGLYIIFA